MTAMWRVENHRGSAADFHGRDMPSVIVPSVQWFHVEQSALVLGSAQPIEHVDVEACARAGVEIVRRRSGGGAVLVEPNNVLWADVLIPFDHAMWTNDVSSSAWWLGEVWLHTLDSLGMTGLHVHRGAMREGEWSRRVCFAGVGGGEVMLGERKVVGISQRRTRAGARFQCAVYSRWHPERVAELMAEPRPSVADLEHVVAVVPMGFAQIRDAMGIALDMLS